MITINSVKILSLLASSGGPPAIVYRAAFAVDADGAPNAYAPDDKGLDHIDNAGHPARWVKCALCEGADKTNGGPGDVTCANCAGKGKTYEPAHWPGLVTAGDELVTQGPADPFPGAYISQSSLQDERFAVTDPRRYVDSTRVPYIAVPPQLLEMGLSLGDLGMACLEIFDKSYGQPARSVIGYKCGAGVVADRGPRKRIGEGSICLAQTIGLSGNPRNGGLERARREVVWILFPGSGAQAPSGLAWPRTVASFTEQANDLFARFGGYARAAAALVDLIS